LLQVETLELQVEIKTGISTSMIWLANAASAHAKFFSNDDDAILIFQ
jgi:hypothetical protein